MSKVNRMFCRGYKLNKQCLYKPNSHYDLQSCCLFKISPRSAKPMFTHCSKGTQLGKNLFIWIWNDYFILSFSLPSAELQHQCRTPPLDKAGDRLESSVRTDGRWEGRNQSQPGGITGRFNFQFYMKTHTHTSDYVVLKSLLCSYHWGSLMITNSRSGCCRIHVAEKSISLPERNTTAPVTDLEHEEWMFREQCRVLWAALHQVISMCGLHD